jgi:hypothetical protein
MPPPNSSRPSRLFSPTQGVVIWRFSTFFSRSRNALTSPHIGLPMKAGPSQTTPARHSTCWLADRSVIDRETATALRGAAGLRNRIAHGYGQLDYVRVHREAQPGIPALRAFLMAASRAAGMDDAGGHEDASV